MNPNEQYQTPEAICSYMADMIPPTAESFLEPTPGKGNLVQAIFRKMEGRFHIVTTPSNYFDKPSWHIEESKYDCVLMNPPFSSKSAFGIPDESDYKGMKIGYKILFECMEMSDSIIALMPWFTISDSDVRLRHIKSYGLKSITALPRKTFEYARIQTCVLELEKGFKGESLFKTFQF